MKVKCKQSNRFLIKDEWYQVISSEIRYENITKKETIYYQLYNHTNKKWNSNWFHETNFYTPQELRDIKINQILTEKIFPTLKKKFFMKFKINQALILHESLKRGDCDWYKPGIFYLKKRYPGGTIKATKLEISNPRNKSLINNDGTWRNELVECHNSHGELLICTEDKFIPAPIHKVREEKINYS